MPSASSKQNPPGKSLDVYFFFRYKILTSSKINLGNAQSDTLPTSFRASSASLRAETQQCDEERQQICAKLRNIYEKQIFCPAMQNFVRAAFCSLELN